MRASTKTLLLFWGVEEKRKPQTESSGAPSPNPNLNPHAQTSVPQRMVLSNRQALA